MADTDYLLGPDSFPQPGVPQGRIEEHDFSSSLIFPGTVRKYWVYVPIQYEPAKPACVMVFQDGWGHIDPANRYRVPVVFDNLINKNEMPVTIGIFVNPGTIPSPVLAGRDRVNRSFEYDSLGDRYVRFLLEEIIPEVEKSYRLVQDADGRAISGVSSGAICAFNAAWERPNAFHRVFCAVGTFTGMRGGGVFPYLVRITEPKPIRVFLEDGSTDLNIFAGNWWLANQEMLSALQFSGYEVRYAWGDRGHDVNHSSAIFPDAVRWLWEGYPQAVQAGVNSLQPVMRVLLPGEGWIAVASDHEPSGSLAVNDKGEVFFADGSDNGVFRISLWGKAEPFSHGGGKVTGMAFGPDGRLYACLAERKQVVAFDQSGGTTEIAQGIEGAEICVAATGRLYVAEPSRSRIWLVIPGGGKQLVEQGIATPSALGLSPDQSQLVVADRRDPTAYLLSIRSDGSLENKAPYFHLNLPNDEGERSAGAVAVDCHGWVYFSTSAGLQVADNEGRIAGLISPPTDGPISGLVFGGAGFKELYVISGGTIYKRRTRAMGYLPFRAPINPESRSSF
jgi:sugar lactone lactonase YvrE